MSAAVLTRTVWQVFVYAPPHTITEGFQVGEFDTEAEAIALRDDAELIHADGISEGSERVGIVRVSR